LYALSADLELETVQARDVGRLDYEGYTFVHHASWAGPWAFCALQSEPSINCRLGALYGHAGEARLHSPLYVLSADPELEAVQARDAGRPDCEGYTIVHHALGRHAEGLSGFGNHENAICGSEPNRGVPNTARREGSRRRGRACPTIAPIRAGRETSFLWDFRECASID
jgi:hypothetical protein